MDFAMLGPRVGAAANSASNLVWAMAYWAVFEGVKLCIQCIGLTYDVLTCAITKVVEIIMWTKLDIFQVISLLLASYLVFVALSNLINSLHLFVKLTRQLYLFWFGKSFEYPKMDRLVVRHYKGNEVTEEGAYGGAHFKNKIDGMPKGVVQIFNEIDKQLVFAGHGTYLDGVYATDWHVIRPAVEDNAKVYVATLNGGKALPVEIKKESLRVDQDYAELHVGNTAAILGVKKRKSAFLKSSLITVYTFNPDEKQYFSSTVYFDKYDPDSGFTPYVLLTKSDTHGGDSGLPIEQGGFVIGRHKGGSERLKRNVHLLNVVNIMPTIEKIAASKQDILVDDRAYVDESPTNSQEYDDAIKRARAIRDIEEEERFRRQRGEHVDDQGYRRKDENLKSSLNSSDLGEDVKIVGGKGKGGVRRYQPPVFRDKDWNDIEDENQKRISLIAKDADRRIRSLAAQLPMTDLEIASFQTQVVTDMSLYNNTEKMLSSDLKVTAPQEGAIQVSCPEVMTPGKEVTSTKMEKIKNTASLTDLKKTDVTEMSSPTSSINRSSISPVPEMEGVSLGLNQNLEKSINLQVSQKPSDSSSMNSTQTMQSGKRRRRKSQESKSSEKPSTLVTKPLNSV